MARLAALLGHDPTDKRTPLGEKLLSRTRYGRIDSGAAHECNRLGCQELAVLWFQSGHAKKRHLCRDHLVAIVADMASAEEKTHIDGLPELLSDMLNQVD